MSDIHAGVGRRSSSGTRVGKWATISVRVQTMISGAGVVRVFHVRAICHALATLGLGPSWRNGFTQIKCSVGGPALGWETGPQGVMVWGQSQDNPNKRTSAMAPVLADSIIFIPLTILRNSFF